VAAVDFSLTGISQFLRSLKMDDRAKPLSAAQVLLWQFCGSTTLCGSKSDCASLNQQIPSASRIKAAMS